MELRILFQYGLEVVADSSTYQLQCRFLHRPKTDKRDSWVGSLLDALQFLVIHRVLRQRILIRTDRLHIDSHGRVTDHAGSSLLAVTEVEIDLWMSDDTRLPMRVVFKDRILCDTIILAEALLQQLVGQHAESLALLKLELQRLFPSLRRNLLQCRLKVFTITYSLLQPKFRHWYFSVGILLGSQGYQLLSLLHNALPTRYQLVVRKVVSFLCGLQLLT